MQSPVVGGPADPIPRPTPGICPQPTSSGGRTLLAAIVVGLLPTLATGRRLRPLLAILAPRRGWVAVAMVTVPMITPCLCGCSASSYRSLRWAALRREGLVEEFGQARPADRKLLRKR